ncbi:UDP-glucose 4-epimerase GalE [Pontibacter sp. BT310]|uniref:UDP-glucose 4-epimerase n=1 Tax=Pontibacter populi TaxID=890055 RepID=A0ABS6X920_9BACT|nr:MULTISPECIES: UDP-glucose 4-epimerase GalE [Pontibacter]MBJ6117508.1 UDP-glucose 4-epimerase GalE [Pontibacter sp. BT310]MBR0569933.1 UDP-glucose 4-epimerase GalE [Microvirga sp. STS03]MBW3364361.1 UDP-glucose 4-epimerase GalE [Pontibacter populi]
MQKILVTGGAGYIGSHTVVELQQAGYDPVIVDNFSNSEERSLEGIKAILGQEVKCHRIDCTDAAALGNVFEQEQNIVGVIHFAAYKAVGESVEKPLMYYHNNVGSLVTLLQVMKEFDVQKLVFSSSCTVYGIPEQLPVTEQTPVQKANSPYGNSKKVCEEILTDLANSGNSNIKSIALRYFNPIGAHPSAQIGELPLGVPNNLVPFITQTAAGIREQITVFGDDYDTPDGTCIRDYVYVVDLAKAHVVAIERLLQNKADAIELFNVGTGQGNTVLEAIHAFERATGVKLNYKIGPRRPGDIPKIYADVTKATEELGFKTNSTLEQAMKSAWDWQLHLQNTKANL